MHWVATRHPESDAMVRALVGLVFLPLSLAAIDRRGCWLCWTWIYWWYRNCCEGDMNVVSPTLNKSQVGLKSPTKRSRWGEVIRYHKVESLVGPDFFDYWKFYSGPDPTHGTVRGLRRNMTIGYNWAVFWWQEEMQRYGTNSGKICSILRWTSSIGHWHLQSDSRGGSIISQIQILYRNGYAMITRIATDQ